MKSFTSRNLISGVEVNNVEVFCEGSTRLFNVGYSLIMHHTLPDGTKVERKLDKLEVPRASTLWSVTTEDTLERLVRSIEEDLAAFFCGVPRWAVLEDEAEDDDAPQV